MAPLHHDSTLDLSVLPHLDAAATPGADVADVERDVLLLFDRHAAALLRYVASCGLARATTEDVVQDVYLALFRHLGRGGDRRNLRGWLFTTAHHLALKERRRLRRHPADSAGDDLRIDPALSPEARLASQQRRVRIRSIVRALPDRDRQCLLLRAEGLRYRDIAAALGMSIGGVAKSLTRAIARLVNAGV